MGLTYKDLYNKHITCMSGHPSEITYWVNGKTHCFRPLKELGKRDQYCEKGAGWGTDHLHEGACKAHLGTAERYKHSSNGHRYAHVTKRRLRKKFLEYSSDPHMLNLVPELSMQRTILAHLLEDLQEDGKISLGKLDRALSILRDIAVTVEKIEKIQSQKTLTIAKVRLIMAVALNVVEQFVPTEKLPLFVLAWQERVVQELGFSHMELIDGN